MLTDTFLGRCLLWRGPTARDHQRFPWVAAGSRQALALPPAPVPTPCEAIRLPAAAGRPAGTLAELLRATGTSAFVAVRGRRVLCEWYASNVDPAAPARNQSVTKSVASVLLAQAVGLGHIRSLETPLGELLPRLADPRVEKLTLTQLLRMASGIGYKEGAVPWSDDARVYHGTRLRQAVLARRVTDPVDQYFHDNDWHPLLVALVLETATGLSVAELLSRELWQPLAAGAATLTMDHDGDGAMPHLDSGFNCTAMGLARFGQMVLQRGLWEGRALVPHAYFSRLDDLSDAWGKPEHFRHYRGTPWDRPLATGRIAYKDFWWHHLPEAGVHDLFAMGALGAHVYISPDTGCVLVRQASRFPRGVWWAGTLRQVAEQLSQRP